MESHRETLRELKADVLRPSKWISSYENFVTKNLNTVNQVESALRSLTYIIPGLTICSNESVAISMLIRTVGRFRDSELPSECRTILSLLVYRYDTDRWNI